MNELIKLSPTEQFLANTNMSITLKEIADKYNIVHKNSLRDFKKMVLSLKDDEIDRLKFEPISFKDQYNRDQTTLKLDLKTMLWFMSKFDHSLRLQFIDYAFEKLEKEKALAVNEAKKPRIYYDGNMSVRRCISEAWEDDDEKVPNESDVWDALIWKGFAKTKAKVTTTKVVPSGLEGHVGAMKNRGFATYKPNTIKSVWLEFEKAGKPVKSERERLVEEFEEISKYYKDKIDKET